MAGFTDKQFEFAACWWGAALIGLNPRECRSLWPEGKAAQEGIDKRAVVSELFSLNINSWLSNRQLDTFIGVLQMSAAMTARDGVLQKAPHGGQYLALDMQASPPINDACEAAGFRKQNISGFARHQFLYLHDDGQIFHEARNGMGHGHIGFAGCAKPDFRILRPMDIAFPTQLKQAEYGRFLVMPMKAGARVPLGVYVPSDVTGFDGEQRPRRFADDVYLAVPEDCVRKKGGTPGEPADILKLWRVNRKDIAVMNRKVLPGTNVDMIADLGRAPHECAGEFLAKTDRAGVYENVSAPFQEVRVPEAMQFGAGEKNVRLKRLDRIIKFADEPQKSASPAAPVVVAKDGGFYFCIFAPGTPNYSPYIRNAKLDNLSQPML